MSPMILFLAVSAQSETLPAIPAVRTDDPPRIDGFLEDVWDGAGAIDTVLTQYGPDYGAPQSERTTIMFLYDTDNLYVGFSLHHSDPAGMNDDLCPRDNYMPGEWIALILDTWANGRQAFSFEVNLANSQMDSRLSPEGWWDYSWDAVWRSATARSDSGWSAEMSIPMSCLRFPESDSQRWRFNIQRVIYRGGENGWMILSRSTDQADLDHFATLEGLSGLGSTVGIEFRPYVAGTALGPEPGADGWETGIDAGLDTKMGISSGVVADLAVNPDFGQVEADQEEMNLSHFELFRDEKRPFFLESADLFRMPFELFYSRRIGAVTPGGEVIPIIGGAKVSGNLTEDLSFGFLDAVTGRVVLDDGTPTVPATNFGVLRVVQGFGPWSNIGLSATSVDVPGQDGFEGGWSRAGALDGRLQVTDEFLVSGAAAGTWEDSGERGGAYALEMYGQGESHSWNLSSSYTDRGFDANAAGYTTSTGELRGGAGYTQFFTPGGPFARSAVTVDAWYSTDPVEDVVLGRGAGAHGDFAFRNGGHVGGRFAYGGPRFDPWEGPDGRFYPAAAEGGIWAGTDWYAPVTLNIEMDGGQYQQDGTFESLSASTRISPSPAASFRLSASAFRTFNADVWNWETSSWDMRNTDWRSLVANAGWMFGPDAGLRVFSQYARFESVFDQTGGSGGEQLRFNALYSLRYRPGSMFYLLGELSTERTAGGGWERTVPGLFAKITWFEAF